MFTKVAFIWEIWWPVLKIGRFPVFWRLPVDLGELAPLVTGDK